MKCTKNIFFVRMCVNVLEKREKQSCWKQACIPSDMCLYIVGMNQRLDFCPALLRRFLFSFLVMGP
jgi:hypothetical protein